MFGVAEDHDSNPIKTGIAKLKARGAKFVSVNPVQTGYSAVADEWIGRAPAPTGCSCCPLCTSCCWPIASIWISSPATRTPPGWCRNPGGADDGLFVRNEAGKPLAWDRATGAPMDAATPDMQPQIAGEIVLPDGRRAYPVFHLLAERYLDGRYAPEVVADTCGISAATIRRIARELAQVAFNQAIELDQPWTDTAGRRHDKMLGRPVAMHAPSSICSRWIARQV